MKLIIGLEIEFIEKSASYSEKKLLYHGEKILAEIISENATLKLRPRDFICIKQRNTFYSLITVFKNKSQ